MTNDNFINSGIPELYVLGLATAEEAAELERRLAESTDLKTELDRISAALESYALAAAVAPSAATKAFLLASLDYESRLAAGELPAARLPLTGSSTPADFAHFTERADFVCPEGESLYAKFINREADLVTAVVWLKSNAAEETHDEYESFLILEGSCDIIVEDKVFPLSAGDFFTVPPHKKHEIKITSAARCKAIVQRVAA